MVNKADFARVIWSLAKDEVHWTVIRRLQRPRNETASKAVREKIWELKSSVSSLAMQAVLDNTQEQNQEPSIIITHHARPWMHAMMSLWNLQRLAQWIKVEEKLDSPFKWNFPEWIAQYLEWDTESIERNISLLQDKMNSLPVSDEQVQKFQGIVERYRYGIYHLYSLIWSANEWLRQEEMNKIIWIATKLVADTKLELVILLHKFWVTEVLDPYYWRKAIDKGIGTINDMRITPIIWIPDDEDLIKY